MSHTRWFVASIAIFAVGLFAIEIPSASAITISGTIFSSTSWSSLANVYELDGIVTVDTGVTLTIQSGVIVKFKTTGSKLDVNGILKAQGTSGSKIYFTSYKDDSVGGDTNGDATSTSPAAGDWDTIRINSGASSTITHAIVRYGSGGAFPGYSFYNNGGLLTLDNTEVATGTTFAYGIYNFYATTTIISSNLHHHRYGVLSLGAAGTSLTISSSTISDHSLYGVKVSGGIGSFTGNTFSNNTSGAAYIDFDGQGIVFTHSTNTASGSGIKAFIMSGAIAASQTWNQDGIPYVLSTFSVPSGKTLTIDSGVIIKFTSTGSERLTVTGALNAQGTSGNKIYFTSLRDDSVGGDTNGDATSTTPSAPNWEEIKIESGASATLTHAVVRYGGYAGDSSVIYNNGGTLTLSDSEVDSGTTYGIRQLSGTSTITYTNIHHFTNGILLSSGVSSISSGEIHDTTYGVNLGGGTATIQAEDIHTNSSRGITMTGGTVAILDSAFHDQPYGLYISDGTVSSMYTSNVYDNSSYGVYVLSGTVNIRQSTISTNTTANLYNNGGTLDVENTDIATSTNYGIRHDSGTTRVTTSQIHGQPYGLYVTGSGASAGSNSIHDNSTYGAYSSGSHVDAEYNYWDAANGPSGVGPGSGDAVSSNVDYDPFLTQEHYVLVNSSGVLYSSVDSGEIRWDGNASPFNDAWYASVSTWNTLGSITIATDTIFTIEDLTVSTTTRSDLSWAGAWTSYVGADTLELNSYYLDDYTASQKRNVISHELGHALGLDHSYPGNIMLYYTNSQTALGTQDTSDYDYLW